MSEAAELLELYEHAPLIELAALADAERRRRHPDGVVTYIVDRNINYTNVCVADCKFCAFYRRPKHAEGYVLSFEEIGRKIERVGGSFLKLEPVRLAQRRARGDLKRLKVALAVKGLQADCAKLRRNVLGGLLQLGRTGGAPA